jgi:hypothetical protein
MFDLVGFLSQKFKLGNINVKMMSKQIPCPKPIVLIILIKHYIFALTK